MILGVDWQWLRGRLLGLGRSGRIVFGLLSDGSSRTRERGRGRASLAMAVQMDAEEDEGNDEKDAVVIVSCDSVGQPK